VGAESFHGSLGGEIPGGGSRKAFVGRNKPARSKEEETAKRVRNPERGTEPGKWDFPGGVDSFGTDTPSCTESLREARIER